ncbi:alpha-glucosidase [Altererythrobacter sp. ZODW24]|uniref:alpha-glucosidase n=1 Tax=Altererythrobacter sp. ZODW24 TaxID=2185142 RepID=UPI001F07B77D|nr:alpha-glucosidase [Altererythrobacter sp. ZODW24]
MTALHFQSDGQRLRLFLGELLLLDHSPENPCVAIGSGTPDVTMDKGNFVIDDLLERRTELLCTRLQGNTALFSAEEHGEPLLTIEVRDSALHFRCSDPAANRLWLNIASAAGERIWGGGEQMSYLALNGRRFPLWTSEPGVGRDPSDAFTQMANAHDRSGGDYWTTNYPQPTWLSSQGYALHLDSRAFAAFDFTNSAQHTVECWEIPSRIELFVADEMVDLVSQLSARFGRQPRLPDWAIEGAVIGLKDGNHSFERLDAIIAAGVKVSAIWCEDWAGIRETSFGRRLFWDWTSSEERYPDLKTRIADLRERGIRFMAYTNPYLAVDGTLYLEAEQAGFLVLGQDDDAPHIVDFGEFNCGLVDFTNPAAADWFADRILTREMLDIGIIGWMADFGEYLPVDVRLHDGSDPLLTHNHWPVVWAEVNARAIKQAGLTGDATFFMRAGHSGIGEHCPLLWAGDQCVDFSRHDGIESTIRAALSAGLVGNAYHHSDIGGYTSLYGKVRTPELMMRWAELAAFTPVMRTHEGNRPDDNMQIDDDPAVLAHFARMTRIHTALAPYVRSLCEEAATTGLPLQRPLFLHYPGDETACGIETQYLYGRDMLVAPVTGEGASDWRVYFPAGDNWVHFFDGKPYQGGNWAAVDVPFGSPPVFIREGGEHHKLFTSIRTEFS